MPFDFANTKAFQTAISDEFAEVFEDCEVRTEWCALQGKRGTYLPRVDLAVGPFSVVAGGNKTHEHAELINRHAGLIERLIEIHNHNMAQFDGGVANLHGVLHGNTNARCLLAVEIEAKGSRKHLLGDYVNAGALGRIGLVVPWDDAMMRAFVRIAGYFEFLRGVNKRTFMAPNVLIVGASQLWNELEDLD